MWACRPPGYGWGGGPQGPVRCGLSVLLGLWAPHVCGVGADICGDHNYDSSSSMFSVVRGSCRLSGGVTAMVQHLVRNISV